jgi:hypothetical protein
MTIRLSGISSKLLFKLHKQLSNLKELYILNVISILMFVVIFNRIDFDFYVLVGYMQAKWTYSQRNGGIFG